MRRLAVAITGLELPAVEKISQSREEDPFQVTIATLLSARTQDATTYRGVRAFVQEGGDAAGDGQADGQADREADLSRQLLPLQGAIHQSDVREADEGFRRQDALDDGGAADAAGRRAQDGEPGVDSRVRKPEEHLRRHARPSHCEPAGLGAARRRRTKRSRRCISATESRWWPYINLYLVTWGQNVCRPVYPRCPACAIKDLCPRIGVTVVSKTMPESYPLDPAMGWE